MISDLPKIVLKEITRWERVSKLYDFLLPELRKKYPGCYFLVHTESLKSAVGMDDEGGCKDASKKYVEQHGVMYGQFFGVNIPK